MWVCHGWWALVCGLTPSHVLSTHSTSKRTTQPVVWWWYAEALDAIGDDRAAAEARDRAYSLGLNQGGSHAQ